MLYVDDITRGDLLGYQIAMPAALTANVKLQMTLAYASPVDPTQPTEYTSASLELALRPHHRAHTFRPRKESPRRAVHSTSVVWRHGNSYLTVGARARNPLPSRSEQRKAVLLKLNCVTVVSGRQSVTIA